MAREQHAVPDHGVDRDLLDVARELAGAGELFIAVIVFIGPLLLIYALVFPADLKPCWSARRSNS